MPIAEQPDSALSTSAKENTSGIQISVFLVMLTLSTSEVSTDKIFVELELLSLVVDPH